LPKQAWRSADRAEKIMNYELRKAIVSARRAQARPLMPVFFLCNYPDIQEPGFFSGLVL